MKKIYFFRFHRSSMYSVLVLLSAVNICCIAGSMNIQKNNHHNNKPKKSSRAEAKSTFFSIVKIKTYPKYSSFEEASLYTVKNKVSRKKLKNDEFFNELSKQNDNSFRKLFIRALRKSQYQDFFLEFMPIKANRQSKTAVKFMLINC